MILNKTNIEAIELPTDGYSIHWDDNLKGFGLRVTTAGVKAFIVQQRIKGKEHRITIGRYGALTAEQGRKEAKKLIGSIAKGDDPVAEKQRQKSVIQNCRRSLHGLHSAANTETTVDKGH